jgi:hypothetical protein
MEAFNNIKSGKMNRKKNVWKAIITITTVMISLCSISQTATTKLSLKEAGYCH